jgi:glycosyltransferase involved in cell wall biosynthesis
MPTFSLIIPTVGRTEELEKMIASLSRQEPADFELIVVDQNDDDRVAPLLTELAARKTVKHVRLSRKNLCAARNAGLEHTSGEIVAFPDDDCWYPEGLLPTIEKWFDNNSGYDILATGANDENGNRSGNRWFQDQCDISPVNALRTTFSNSLFVRRTKVPNTIRFDEKLLASEETDWILRLIKAGLPGRFDRTISVGHPCRDMLSGTVTHSRARKYGKGMGQLVRRHSLPGLWLSLLSYDLLRAVVVTLRGKFSMAGFCLAHASGLFSGFVSPEPQRS